MKTKAEVLREALPAEIYALAEVAMLQHSAVVGYDVLAHKAIAGPCEPANVLSSSFMFHMHFPGREFWWDVVHAIRNEGVDFPAIPAHPEPSTTPTPKQVNLADHLLSLEAEEDFSTPNSFTI